MRRNFLFSRLCPVAAAAIASRLPVCRSLGAAISIPLFLRTTPFSFLLTARLSQRTNEHKRKTERFGFFGVVKARIMWSPLARTAAERSANDFATLPSLR
jgi:hypothetical protein